MKNDEIFKEFCALCLKAKDEKELKKLFHLFLTHEERESLSARFLIVKALLEKEMTQREISERYKVSIAQITRGSNSLKIIDEDLAKFLEKHLR